MEQSFKDLPLSPVIQRAIDDLGYTEMTPIQSQAIPIVLGGHDLLGKSSTGTGKTAAFGLPAADMTESGVSGDPQVLILVPTRELALQVSDEMRKYLKYKTSVKVVSVYGGAPIINQIKQLKKAEIVVGTPGRIMDHMDRRTLKLMNVKMAVLDEADEMLNMGFLDDIKKILRATSPTRQTLLFSATMPAPIMKLTSKFQNNPKLVEIDSGETAQSLIKQYYVEVPQTRKVSAVLRLMKKENITRSLIFCNTKAMVDRLTATLCKEGMSATAIHGDMRQSARTSVMQSFKSGKISILVATDVAARGIDAEGIEAIINYDLPQDPEYYTHRIGRTGRAGKLGAAYTLIAGRGQLFDLANIEEKCGARVEAYELDGMENSNDDTLLTPDQRLEKARQRIERKKESLTKNNVTVVTPSGPSVRKLENALLCVDLGGTHEVSAQHIVRYLTQEAGVRRDAIGEITIGDVESFIELSPQDADKVLAHGEAVIKSFVATFSPSIIIPKLKKHIPRSGPRGGSRSGSSFKRK